MQQNSHTLAATDLERCAEFCHECNDACLRLIPHCLSMGGAHATANHIGMLMDCAAICSVGHSFLHRKSPLHQETCRACAAVCNACAEHCDRIAQGDAEMTSCANACRACAEMCRTMSS